MNRILNIACELRIQEHIRYFGIISNPAIIARILSACDIGIIPYDDHPLWKRTYSTKLFEYCAIGLPVIATVHEDSILASLIKENNVGIIVPPVDPDSLASGIQRLSENNELTSQFSLHALRFARKYDRLLQAKKLLVNIIRKINEKGQLCID